MEFYYYAVGQPIKAKLRIMGLAISSENYAGGTGTKPLGSGITLISQRRPQLLRSAKIGCEILNLRKFLDVEANVPAQGVGTVARMRAGKALSQICAYKK